MSGVSYTLVLDGAPLAPEVMSGIEQLEVEDHSRMADMLRLRLSTGLRDDGSGWSHLDDDLFRRLAQIKVRVALGPRPAETVIESYVIETETELSNVPGQSVLNVVAMDPTVLMNLDEKVQRWPDMADSDIASTLFGEYGFSLDVEPTKPPRPEVDYTPIQRGTDIQFLQHLAKRNGYECFVESSPTGGQPVGHFHLPRPDQIPQGVLSVNLGEATNVDSFKARFDMLLPSTAQVTGLDVKSHEDQPAGAEESGLPGMGNTTALERERPRKVLLSQLGLAQTAELQIAAQAAVDRSSWAITAEGELNSVVFGKLLRAKRPVLIRGAGRQFSGLYYVDKVLHVFNGDGYVQRFSLRRNALGLTRQENFVEDQALPA